MPVTALVGDGSIDPGVAVIPLGLAAVFDPCRHAHIAAGQGEEVGLVHAEVPGGQGADAVAGGLDADGVDGGLVAGAPSPTLGEVTVPPLKGL